MGASCGASRRHWAPYVLAHGLGEIFGAETGLLLAREPDTARGPDLAAEVLSPEDSSSTVRERGVL
jgi:hypothetical protein